MQQNAFPALLKSKSTGLLIGLLFLSMLFPVPGQAQAQPGSGHWVSLFDGKDLKGWHQLNGKAHYTVKDGAIVGESEPNTPNSFLVTDGTYGDFILELDFLVDSTLNSGIQIRSHSTPDFKNGRVHGYQVEIDPSFRAWTAGIYEEGDRGWLYPLTLNSPAQKAFQQGQWNHLHIECIGHTIRTWINGVPAANLQDNSSQSGFIGLQVHQENKAGETVMFRHLMIQTRNLHPRPPDHIFVVNEIPNTLSTQEKYNGVQLLWDGHTTAGWRGIFKTTFPDTGWEIHDGELTIHSSNGHEEGSGGDLVTDKEYSVFELQFEFKYTDTANSGVKYFVKESYKPGGKSGIGLEYQILDDAHHPDAKLGRNGDRTLSSLYDLIPRKDIPQAFKPIGEWNQGRIIVFPNGHVEHWLNGFKVLEYERGSQEFKDLIAISKYKNWKNFGLWKEGNILLQDHGTEVSFRSIKIKLL